MPRPEEEKLVTMANPEAATTTAEPEAEEEKVVSAQIQPDPAPAYEPNFKFKVLDEEKEIDEYIRPIIKDKETEAKVRELLEKAHGLEHVKTKVEQERQKYETAQQQQDRIQAEYHQYQQTIEEVLELREKDLGMFLHRLQLDPVKLAKYLADTFEAQEKMKDLPEPFRNMYNEVVNLRSEVGNLRKQNGDLSSTATGSLVQARTQDLNRVLGSPEYKSVAEQYDSRVGKPGMFQTMVMRHGKAEHEYSGRDLSAEEATSEVAKLLGLQPQVTGQVTTPNASPTTPAPTTSKVVVQQKPTVIPKVGGTASTPTSVRPKSTDDLRKMFKAMSEG